MSRLALLACLGLGSVLWARPARAQLPAATANHPPEGVDPLRPGDVIRLRVWREPDFSGDFSVDESGVVVLPRLGALNVGREVPESLKATLTSEYRTFLTHSSIEVVFLKRVQITGAVQKPGLYHVDPLMTIGDALAMAGGVLSTGREDKVEIIREGDKLPGRLSGRMLISQSPVRSGDQLYVPQRSWLSRNLAIVVAGISAAATVAYVVNR